MKRKLQFLVATMLITCMLSTTCFAADNTMDGSHTESSTTVTVDTTKTGTDGSLPDSFAYKVTVPATMVLKVKDQNATSIDVNTVFEQTATVTFKGTAGSGQHVKIVISSQTDGDSGTVFTLKKSESESAVGKFYIGSDGATSYEASSAADKTAMLTSTGLVKNLVVTDVKGVDKAGVYTGGLSYTISVESDVAP